MEGEDAVDVRSSDGLRDFRRPPPVPVGGQVRKVFTDCWIENEVACCSSDASAVFACSRCPDPWRFSFWWMHGKSRMHGEGEWTFPGGWGGSLC